MIQRVESKLGDKTIIIETGKLAKQAGGAVTVQCGDTIVLVTAVVGKEPRAGVDFLPLTCDFIEKTFAAGKIPGGFFKREGRPSELATLTSRFIDRPIRPLFPEGFHNDMQVMATVLSADEENEADMLAMIGASAALVLSEAPFAGPIAGVRVGRIGGQLKINPTEEEMDSSDIDLIVAGSKDAVVMVEGGADEVSEKDVVDAILFAHREMQVLLKAQIELREKAGGKEKIVVTPPQVDEALRAEITKKAEKGLMDALHTSEKKLRNSAIKALKDDLKKTLVPEDDDGTKEKEVKQLFEDLHYKLMRQMILDDKIRIDGRGYENIRPITCEVGILPRAHGSALFTRGETQAIVATTLGSKDDEQIIDALKGEWKKRFLLHYNFPPFSTGEVKPLRSPGRREVGHGALAERALKRVSPDHSDFPYTIRIVSEILESNGSSSMASVCGGSLSLMDAGVPMKAPVAGIAMGLVKEGDKVAVLSDILGDEDHLGDMDFKVTGTANGITALQMDIKIAGLDAAILSKALDQARAGRLHILGIMNQTIEKARDNMSPYAPRIKTVHIPRDKIGELIGPGGKNIRGIIEETGVKIDVNDEGQVNIYSNDEAALLKALSRVEGVTAVPEMDKVYQGKVVRIAEFGAFVQVLPNVDGLLHVSEIAYERVNNVRDVLNEGDIVEVKVIRIDPDGKVALSRKALLPKPEGYVEPAPRSPRPPSRDRDSRGGGGFDRGGRGGPRGGGGGGGFRR